MERTIYIKNFEELCKDIVSFITCDSDFYVTDSARARVIEDVSAVCGEDAHDEMNRMAGEVEVTKRSSREYRTFGFELTDKPETGAVIAWTEDLDDEEQS